MRQQPIMKEDGLGLLKALHAGKDVVQDIKQYLSPMHAKKKMTKTDQKTMSTKYGEFLIKLTSQGLKDLSALSRGDECFPVLVEATQMALDTMQKIKDFLTCKPLDLERMWYKLALKSNSVGQYAHAAKQFTLLSQHLRVLLKTNESEECLVLLVSCISNTVSCTAECVGAADTAVTEDSVDVWEAELSALMQRLSASALKKHADNAYRVFTKLGASMDKDDPNLALRCRRAALALFVQGASCSLQLWNEQVLKIGTYFAKSEDMCGPVLDFYCTMNNVRQSAFASESTIDTISWLFAAECLAHKMQVSAKGLQAEGVEPTLAAVAELVEGADSVEKHSKELEVARKLSNRISFSLLSQGFRLNSEMIRPDKSFPHLISLLRSYVDLKGTSEAAVADALASACVLSFALSPEAAGVVELLQEAKDALAQSKDNLSTLLTAGHNIAVSLYNDENYEGAGEILALICGMCSDVEGLEEKSSKYLQLLALCQQRSGNNESAVESALDAVLSSLRNSSAVSGEAVARLSKSMLLSSGESYASIQSSRDEIPSERYAMLLWSMISIFRQYDSPLSEIEGVQVSRRAHTFTRSLLQDLLQLSEDNEWDVGRHRVSVQIGIFMLAHGESAWTCGNFEDPEEPEGRAVIAYDFLQDLMPSLEKQLPSPAYAQVYADAQVALGECCACTRDRHDDAVKHILSASHSYFTAFSSQEAMDVGDVHTPPTLDGVWAPSPDFFQMIMDGVDYMQLHREFSQALKALLTPYSLEEFVFPNSEHTTPTAVEISRCLSHVGFVCRDIPETPQRDLWSLLETSRRNATNGDFDAAVDGLNEGLSALSDDGTCASHPEGLPRVPSRALLKSDFQNVLATCLWESGQFNEALDVAKRALQIRSAVFQSGDINNARRWGKGRWRLLADVCESFLQVGDMMEQMGCFKEAEFYYSQGSDLVSPFSRTFHATFLLKLASMHARAGSDASAYLSSLSDSVGNLDEFAQAKDPNTGVNLLLWRADTSLALGESESASFFTEVAKKLCGALATDEYQESISLSIETLRNVVSSPVPPKRGRGRKKPQPSASESASAIEVQPIALERGLVARTATQINLRHVQLNGKTLSLDEYDNLSPPERAQALYFIARQGGQTQRRKKISPLQLFQTVLELVNFGQVRPQLAKLAYFELAELETSPSRREEFVNLGIGVDVDGGAEKDSDSNEGEIDISSLTLDEHAGNGGMTFTSLYVHNGSLHICRRETAHQHSIAIPLNPKYAAPWLEEGPLCVEGANVLSEILSELKQILEESTLTTKEKDVETKEAKEKWWDKRSSLDKQLEALLQRTESSCLGPWRGMLLGSFRDSSRQQSFEDALQMLAKEVESAKQSLQKPAGKGRRTKKTGSGDGVDIELLRVVLIAVPFSTEVEVEFAVKTLLRMDAMTDECSRTASELSRRFVEEMGEIVEGSVEDVALFEPTLLTLDSELQALPWESLPVLMNRAVARSPSTRVYTSRFREADRHVVDTKKLFYVVDPDGDLATTRATLEPMFRSQKHWKGFSGEKPSVEEFRNGISSSDLFVYSGHGSGEKYITKSELELCQKGAVTLLMGCSSGAMHNYNVYSARGMILSYLKIGCPAVVANLWDVTDKDIDRFTQKVLKNWLTDKGVVKNQKMSFLDALPQSRNACRLRYLNGAAPVYYGIPIFVKSRASAKTPRK